MDELTYEVKAVMMNAEYPLLVTVPYGDYRKSLITATKNMRTELKVAFPGVKFSIKSERYSGGDSVRVQWTDGPKNSAVMGIVKKYQDGHFDGMTDYYEYSNDPFTDFFGGAKYVFAQRECSDALKAKARAVVLERYGDCDDVDVFYRTLGEM